MSANARTNGILSPSNTEKPLSEAVPPRIVLAGQTGRILCVADIRGDYHELNRLIREHDATAVIHTGDFGFITADSVERMGEKILRHLLQYSPLISPATRSQLLALPSGSTAERGTLLKELNNSSVHFPLSQFPHLLSGAINFPVPVFTVWGLIEDVRVLERFRTGEYEVKNLTVLDEASTRVLDVGGVKLRLFGLGGAVASHKIFDNGEGHATIAGGQGTMWTTALQIGELVDTAQRVYDTTETRLLITSAPVSRTGLLLLLSNTLKADLTISGGLHFRYPASFNEFAIHSDFNSYRHKLTEARETFLGIYHSVRDKIDASLTEQQVAMMHKAVGVANKVPSEDDGIWTNTWHWVLSDAACGHVLFSITDGRISAETKSSGLNFAHRAQHQPAPPSAPVPANTAPVAPAPPRPSNVHENAATSRPPHVAVATATRAPIGPPTNMPARPQGAMPTQPSMTSIKGAATRPPGPPGPPGNLRAMNGPPSGPGPASQTSVPASIPAKPPIQARQPRLSNANNALANQALSAAGMGKDKPADSRPVPPPAQSGNRPTPPGPPAATKDKPSTPISQTNGKPASPAPKDKGKPVPADKKKDEAANGSSRGDRPERSEKSKRDPRPAQEKDKSQDAAIQSEENRDGKTSPAEEGVKTPPLPRKQLSLYLKGIPTPTSEDEIKALFPGNDDKIKMVKIIRDHMSGRQKDYAYVDFNTEEAAQDALKSHGETIRDTPVNVTISNPPTKVPFPPRGRGSFRGGRGSFRGSSFGGNAGAGPRKEGGDSGTASPAPVASGGDKKESGDK